MEIRKIATVVGAVMDVDKVITLSSGDFTDADSNALLFLDDGEVQNITITNSEDNTEATVKNSKSTDGFTISADDKIQLRFRKPITNTTSIHASKTITSTNNLIDGTGANMKYGKNFMDQELLLDNTDILEVTGVYVYDSTLRANNSAADKNENAYITAAKPNKKDSFVLDNGQRDGFYSFGILERKSNASAPTEPLIIFYKYYKRGNGDYCTVDSYPEVDGIEKHYSKIPFYTTSFPLTDSIDFRLYPTTAKLNTTELSFGEKGCPPPDSAVSASLTYYLPRIDSIYINKDGVINVTEGAIFV